MTRLLFSFLVLFAAFAAMPAQADYAKDCTNKTKEARIAACTQAINSGRWKGKRLRWAYFNRGKAYHNTNQPEKALKDLDKAISLEPGRPSSRVMRAIVFISQKQYDRARDDCQIAMATDPKYVLAHYQMGRAYYYLKDYRQSIKYYGQAAKLRPRYSSATNGLGNAHYQLGEYRKALDYYKEALAYNPSSTVIPGNIKLAEKKLGIDSGPAITPVSGERRVALVIGNSRYSSVSSLNNPSRDARAMSETFRKLGFTDVMEVRDLNKSDMERTLVNFADRAQGADWAVIYYAGHGMELGGQNYLIPVDARLKSDRHVALETVNMNSMLDAAGGAKTLRVVILDACRDNPFLAGMQRTNSTRNIGRGLARIEPKGATLVAYAARHGQTAQDGSSGNSPYVRALMKHINEPGLDVSLMFRRVRDSVMKETGNAQEPFTYGSLPGVTLSFRPQ